MAPTPKIYTKEQLEGYISAIKLPSTSKTEENFVPSLGLQIALHSISHIDKSSFYLQTNQPKPEFLWVFKVIWGFEGKIIEDESKLFEEIKEFITRSEDKSRLICDIGHKILGLVDNFDFSNENMDYVESLISGIELNPKRFHEKCEVSGILVYLINEAALFGGILLPDGPTQRVHSRYAHKLSLLSTN